MENVTFSGNLVTIFGVKGLIKDKKWAFDVLWDTKDTKDGYDYMFIEVPPCPVSQSIEEIIKNDTAAGRDHLIDHILVCASVAVRLFLEGRIRKVDLMSATDENGVITIDHVEFCDRVFKMKIKSDWDVQGNLSTATIDSNGEIV